MPASRLSQSTHNTIYSTTAEVLRLLRGLGKERAQLSKITVITDTNERSVMKMIHEKETRVYFSTIMEINFPCGENYGYSFNGVPLELRREIFVGTRANIRIVFSVQISSVEDNMIEQVEHVAEQNDIAHYSCGFDLVRKDNEISFQRTEPVSEFTPICWKFDVCRRASTSTNKYFVYLPETRIFQETTSEEAHSEWRKASKKFEYYVERLDELPLDEMFEAFSISERPATYYGITGRKDGLPSATTLSDSSYILHTRRHDIPYDPEAEKSYDAICEEDRRTVVMRKIIRCIVNTVKEGYNF